MLTEIVKYSGDTKCLTSPESRKSRSIERLFLNAMLLIYY